MPWRNKKVSARKNTPQCSDDASEWIVKSVFNWWWWWWWWWGVGVNEEQISRI